MRAVRLTTTLACLAIVGCDSPAEPTLLTAPEGINASKGRVVASANGSAHFTLASGVGRTFTFTAKTFGDGSVKGEYQLTYPGGEVIIHGSVVCMTLDGSTARIGGVAEQNKLGYPVSNPQAFTVVDNGQGKNASADQLSLLVTWLGDGGEEPFPGNTVHCNEGLSLNLFGAERGNVQVSG